MRAIDAQHYILEVVLQRDRVASFDEYPFSIPAIRHLSRLKLHPEVTFFIGENGSGKSTLLEAIAVAAGLNPEGGSRNFNFGTRASHSPLHRYLRLVRGIQRPRDSYFLRAESFFNVASEIERLDAEPGLGPPITPAYGGESLHNQSHGESFFALFRNRFRGRGLYMLDEPEAALSPSRQLALLGLMRNLVIEKSQFVVATHSPIIMAYPGALILEVSNHGLQEVAYKATEHFALTRKFLNHTEKMLTELFSEEPPHDDE